MQNRSTVYLADILAPEATCATLAEGGSVAMAIASQLLADAVQRFEQARIADNFAAMRSAWLDIDSAIVRSRYDSETLQRALLNFSQRRPR
jgi:hypothetical protein